VHNGVPTSASADNGFGIPRWKSSVNKEWGPEVDINTQEYFSVI